MQINSVTSYNNRTNVKFGDCKKIVCDKSMIKAQDAFENSLLKRGLDKMYVYQVEFIHEWLKEGYSDHNYSMIIKPYKGSLLYRLKNYFNHDFKLPNLPCELKYEARGLNKSDLHINLRAAAVIASAPLALASILYDLAEAQRSKAEGLIDKINRLTVYDAREKIKNVLDKKAQ